MSLPHEPALLSDHQRRLREAFGGRSLELILLPTEQCNLRCTYCYESFALRKMPAEVVDGVIALLRRRAPKLRHLHLSWFGGEPLLAPEIVERVMRAARSCEARHARLRLRSSMTTNAVLLTPAMADRLLSLGVRDFQVTFDGPASTHDHRRTHRGGRPTFDRIWRNVSALAKRKERLEVLLRVHLDRDTLPRTGELLELFATVFRFDSRFRVFFKGVGAWGGPRDETLPLLTTAEITAATTELESRARGLGLAVHALGEAEAVCYAALPGSLVVRANGRLGKCTQALDSDRNDIGHVESDGSLRLRPGALDEWTRGWWTGDATALQCPLHAKVAA